MKKVRTIILSVFVLGILAINVSIVGSRTNGSPSLSSLKTAHAYDLEEIIILCDTGGQGLCYNEVPGQLVMCGETTAFTIDCAYTGHTTDSCTPYDPCA
jgi:hypothetical protein